MCVCVFLSAHWGFSQPITCGSFTHSPFHVDLQYVCGVGMRLLKNPERASETPVRMHVYVCVCGGLQLEAVKL